MERALRGFELPKKRPSYPLGCPALISTLDTGYQRWLVKLLCENGLGCCELFLSWTCLLSQTSLVGCQTRAAESKTFFVFLGTLLIKTDKTSEPEKKLVHHLGMIAGGTGKISRVSLRHF